MAATCQVVAFVRLHGAGAKLAPSQRVGHAASRCRPHDPDRLGSPWPVCGCAVVRPAGVRPVWAPDSVLCHIPILRVPLTALLPTMR